MATSATVSSLQSVLEFLERLERANVAYSLRHIRDALMVVVDIPGERWEIEFFGDGELEVERFVSAGVEQGTPAMLDQLIAEYEG